jgi:hypothetical protein
MALPFNDTYKNKMQIIKICLKSGKNYGVITNSLILKELQMSKFKLFERSEFLNLFVRVYF